MPEIIIPRIMKMNVRLLALPCGTPTGIACAIGETIGLSIGLTSANFRIVTDLRGIGLSVGVLNGIALMQQLQCAGQRAT